MEAQPEEPDAVFGEKEAGIEEYMSENVQI